MDNETRLTVEEQDARMRENDAKLRAESEAMREETQQLCRLLEEERASLAQLHKRLS